MIPGHLPQAWRKPREVPIPDTQFSFGDEEEGGGEVWKLEASLDLEVLHDPQPPDGIKFIPW